MRRFRQLIGLAALGVLTSCIGISSDLVIRGDGSGTFTLEYRVSRTLESLGRLDGNESRPVVPAGRADFERTAARTAGLTLRDFASREEGKDLVTTVKMDFANLDALLGFLDASGQRAVLSRENGGTRLSFVLGEPSAADPALRELIRSVSEGYTLEFRFTLPGNSGVAFLDGNGGTLAAPPAGTAGFRDGTGAYSVAMADLLSAPEAVIMELRW
jgi:hypothetical protein